MTGKKTQAIIGIIVGFVLVGSGSFYAGMQYGQGQRPGDFRAAAGGANLTPEQRQARQQQFAGGGSGRGGAGNQGFANGEILSKDDKSITIKLADGGSKIVFWSTTTQVMKAATSSPQDLMTGEQVTAMGSANSDGSITAQSIQIRPSGAPVPAN